MPTFDNAAVDGYAFASERLAGRRPPFDVPIIGRVAAGVLTLLVVLAVTRDRLPRDLRLWGHLSVVALLGVALPLTLFGFGEQRIPSLLAGIWNATTPLIALPLAAPAAPGVPPGVPADDDNLVRTLGATVKRSGRTTEADAHLIADFSGRPVAIFTHGEGHVVNSKVVQQAIAGKSRHHCQACAVIINRRFTGGAQDFAQRSGCTLIGIEQFPDFVMGRREL